MGRLLSLYVVFAVVLGPVACRAGPELGTADSMRFDIAAPAEVQQGEPVPVRLRLTNTSDHPITVYLQGRPTAFDIIVRNPAGAVVWRRLAGQTVTAILGVQTLAAGQSLTFEDGWPQQDQAGRPVPPGRYSIGGALPTDGPEPLLTPLTTIHVQPRP